MSKTKKQSNLIRPETRQVQQITVSQSSMHIGILPPPEVLKHYEDLHPGLAERLICMAERNQEHRISLEKEASIRNDKIIECEYREVNLGQKLGFASVFLLLILCGWIVFMGNPIPGSVLAGTTLLSLGGAYVYRDYKSSKSNKE